MQRQIPNLSMICFQAIFPSINILYIILNDIKYFDYLYIHGVYRTRKVLFTSLCGRNGNNEAGLQFTKKLFYFFQILCGIQNFLGKIPISVSLIFGRIFKIYKLIYYFLFDKIKQSFGEYVNITIAMPNTEETNNFTAISLSAFVPISPFLDNEPISKYF